MRGKSLFRPSLLRQSFNFRSLSSSSSFPQNRNHKGSTRERDSSSSENRSSIFTQENPTLSGPPTFTFVPKSLSEPPKFSFEHETEEPPVPPNVVPVNSDGEFETALGKAEGESQPAVFYFTAKWCAPCRFIGPVLEELARRNPHVTTYKLDIEEEALASTVKKLNVTVVPTVHYFIEGKKTTEVVGADAAAIVQTMKKLYAGGVEVKKDEGEGEKVNEGEGEKVNVEA